MAAGSAIGMTYALRHPERVSRPRFTEPPPLAGLASAADRMKHRLKTIQGRKLYRLRKQTVEPVFGIIKSAMRFRQFLLRGLASARREWTLVTMAWNEDPNSKFPIRLRSISLIVARDQ